MTVCLDGAANAGVTAGFAIKKSSEAGDGCCCCDKGGWRGAEDVEEGCPWLVAESLISDAICTSLPSWVGLGLETAAGDEDEGGEGSRDSEMPCLACLCASGSESGTLSVVDPCRWGRGVEDCRERLVGR